MELSQDSKGISYEEQQLMDESDDVEYSDDDSQEDPTFDALEETRVNFSNLSIKAKSSKRGKRMNEKENEEAKEVLVPELNEQEKKSYESIQKIIEGGQVDKLKVDQCKIYLRKHGLRLSGNKETLIQRIKEHVDIVSGGGEKKYPASSFVLNCKGDACTGDVVMFEQNVYDMFSIASRSATGPPCGTRVVAGRIVKESYGAAKQQHTFTIEVLWSRGEKPLPPLHQLLIKGRNLYRLKTLRQRWEDEGERQRNLAEKHARGDVARLSREARIQQREMRKKNHKTSRETRNEHLNISRDEKRKPGGPINQPNYAHEEEDSEKKTNCYIYPQGSNANTHVPQVGLHQRQPLTSVNCSLQSSKYESSKNPNRGFLREGQHVNYNTARGPIQSQRDISNSNHVKITPYAHTFQENHRFCSKKSPSGGYRQNYALGQSDTKLNSSVYSKQTHACNGHRNTSAANNPPFRERDRVRVQTCRYYAQGRCHFGDRCKYLHGS